MTNLEQESPEFNLAVEADDDLDSEDVESIEKMTKKLQRYINDNHVTKKSYSRQRMLLIKKLKANAESLDILLLSKAYIEGETYAAFLKNHRKLRRALLKSILSRMDADAQIIVLTDLLHEITGDDEPAEYYIT